MADLIVMTLFAAYLIAAMLYLAFSQEDSSNDKN
jgi:hypothetical protein